MKTLETEISVQGRMLKQIQRQGDTALYELYGPQGLLYGYEVIIIKVQKEKLMFDRLVPEHEAYPTPSQFGYLAWSFGTKQRDEALTKFTETATDRTETHCRKVLAAK